jgi:hypothetical protein
MCKMVRKRVSMGPAGGIYMASLATSSELLSATVVKELYRNLLVCFGDIRAANYKFYDAAEELVKAVKVWRHSFTCR